MSQKRGIKGLAGLFARGLAMGAADVVPGVSGGTIAFISGIYEELLSTISSVNLSVIKTLRKEGIAAAWKQINGNFIVALFAGILVSVASLAKGISYVLENHPVLIWSFFFGLVAASILYVAKEVKKWSIGSVIGFIAGAAVAFYITILPQLGAPTDKWFIFVSGAIAICAMILPGISGSFILLLLGSYKLVIDAIKDKEIGTILIFGAGCVVGLLSFSRLLKWMFAKFHDLTIAVLAGFLLGSLNKIWPWKVNDGKAIYTHSDGKEEFMQKNVLPAAYEGEPKIVLAIVLALLGAGIILGMEVVAKKMKKNG